MILKHISIFILKSKELFQKFLDPVKSWVIFYSAAFTFLCILIFLFCFIKTTEIECCECNVHMVTWCFIFFVPFFQIVNVSLLNSCTVYAVQYTLLIL